MATYAYYGTSTYGGDITYGWLAPVYGDAFSLSHIDHDSVDHSDAFEDLKIGTHVVMYDTAEPTKWASFLLMGPPSQPSADDKTWTVFDNITYLDVAKDENGNPNPPKPSAEIEVLVHFEFVRFAPTPITPSTDVINIETPELLIPRIEPTEKTEPSPEDMTEDERTHDGLWVWAVGGLPNT